jgi:RNA ligase.
MGYQHIDNLYKNQTILADPECYALEKIHGTSAHIAFLLVNGALEIKFFSGGEKHENFVKLFDAAKLCENFWKIKGLLGQAITSLTVYGEAYGGKCQGMSGTYGPALQFVAFEVRADDEWLNIPDAETIVYDLGLEFVNYARIKTDMASIDAQRDAASVQSLRNGIIEPKIREGVVLFPLQQRLDHRGNRVVAKHKRDEFRETKTPRVVTEPSIEIVNAQKAAHEFVTEMRLEHVLDKLPEHDITQMGNRIIPAMVEDVLREGAGEVVDCPALRKEIARRTAILYKARLQKNLSEKCDTSAPAMV